MEVFNLERNEFRLRSSVDLLEEEREGAYRRNLKYQFQTAQYYDFGIKKRSFQVGDLVFRELATSMPKKLQLNWEGPYKVVEVVHPDTYKLKGFPGN